MIAVSNSSPVILLSGIGRLHLLRDLFDEVVIPPAVREEVVARGWGRPGAAALAEANWIAVRPVADREAVQELLRELGPGEAEAIALAAELEVPVTLVLDDDRARQAAVQRGFRVVGSAGILVLAKRDGLLALVRPVLDELRSAGLYLSDTVYRGVLTTAGESTQD